MALPTTNITTTLVRNELRAATNNVGELCTHNNINIWSKRKPVRDFRRVVPENEVGLGDNCGLTLHHWSGDDTKFTYYNRPGTWTDKTGQYTTPFRLGDFRGYEHTIQKRPVRVGAKPSNIERKKLTIGATIAYSYEPVVSLSDLPYDLRFGVIIYGKNGSMTTSVFIGAASALEQSDHYVAVDLTSLTNWTSLDIKFALISGHHPWPSAIPTHAYELPRLLRGENRNWIDVPLVTPPENVRTFQIVYIRSTNTIEYSIEAYTSTGAYIYIKDSSGTIVTKIESLFLPANTHVEGTASRALPSGSYTAELYLGIPTTPVAIRPLMGYERP